MTIEEALDYVEDINKTVTWTDEQKVDEAFFDNVKDWLEELKEYRKCTKCAELDGCFEGKRRVGKCDCFSPCGKEGAE